MTPINKLPETRPWEMAQAEYRLRCQFHQDAMRAAKGIAASIVIGLAMWYAVYHGVAHYWG